MNVKSGVLTAAAFLAVAPIGGCMETDKGLNDGLFPQPHRRESVSVESDNGRLFGTIVNRAVRGTR